MYVYIFYFPLQCEITYCSFIECYISLCITLPQVYGKMICTFVHKGHIETGIKLLASYSLVVVYWYESFMADAKTDIHSGVWLVADMIFFFFLQIIKFNDGKELKKQLFENIKKVMNN